MSEETQNRDEYNSMNKIPGKDLVISPEVAQALAENHPVVALESTILAHGLPYPDNIAFATKVETLVRENGAIPATIAIINGQAHVGLAPES